VKSKGRKEREKKEIKEEMMKVRKEFLILEDNY
jgi:hypothetical protein